MPPTVTSEDEWGTLNYCKNADFLICFDYLIVEQEHAQYVSYSQCPFHMFHIPVELDNTGIGSLPMNTLFPIGESLVKKVPTWRYTISLKRNGKLYHHQHQLPTNHGDDKAGKDFLLLMPWSWKSVHSRKWWLPGRRVGFVGMSGLE